VICCHTVSQSSVAACFLGTALVLHDREGDELAKALEGVPGLVPHEPVLLPNADDFLPRLFVSEHSEAVAVLSLKLPLVDIAAQILDLEVFSALDIELGLVQD